MSLDKMLYPVSLDINALNCVPEIQLITKRVLDIIGAILCFILFSPLMVAVAIAIKLTSRGPVMFKQERVGMLGKHFNMLKFRSMYQDASEKMHQIYIENLLCNSTNNRESVDQLADFKSQLDRRTTLVGRFLRKTSLDELPQLINVLRGEMSFVGPRPHPGYEVEKYKKWYYKRLTVKPGITGFSKIQLRCTPMDYEKAMRFDVYYIEHWTLWLDVNILLKTIPLVISGNGAH